MNMFITKSFLCLLKRKTSLNAENKKHANKSDRFGADSLFNFENSMKMYTRSTTLWATVRFEDIPKEI